MIDEFITDYPVCEYIQLKRSDLKFSEKVRFVCKNECQRYGHSWACPPVIGTVEECIKRCEAFEDVLLFTTAADVPDILNFSACLAARRDHEELSWEITQRMRQEYGETLTLTTGCMICDECAYPDEPCRHPDKRFATIESHGIMIMDTAIEHGINYEIDNNTVIYFSLIFFNEKSE